MWAILDGMVSMVCAANRFVRHEIAPRLAPYLDELGAVAIYVPPMDD